MKSQLKLTHLVYLIPAISAIDDVLSGKLLVNVKSMHEELVYCHFTNVTFATVETKVQ